MSAPYVVVTGLPGSGKSTLGAVLAARLGRALIDKDDVLESLYDSLGSPDLDARQRLSRAADDVLFTLAARAPGAVLVNWWDRSTAPQRLGQLDGGAVEVLCDVPWEVAAARWQGRARHPGHHDHLRPWSIRSRYRALLPGAPVVVDTGAPVDGEAVAAAVQAQHAGH